MKLANTVSIPVSIALGITSGYLWFTFGEFLNSLHVSNFIAWFICPALLPLAISAVLFMMNTSATLSARAVNSLLFFVVFYAMHWAPMGVWVCQVVLAGGM